MSDDRGPEVFILLAVVVVTVLLLPRYAGAPGPSGTVPLMSLYQTLRSVSDHLVFVVCRDGSFYERVPVHVEGNCAGSAEDRRFLFS